MKTGARAGRIRRKMILQDQCNRYTFRLRPEARAKARASGPFLTSKVAKRWHFI